MRPTRSRRCSHSARPLVHDIRVQWIISTSTVDPQTSHTVLSVSYTITNTGNREGAEPSQVYVALPALANEPSKRLVGFQKVDLMPAESKEVTVTIDPSASNHPLSYWIPDIDAPVSGWANGTWTAAPGDYSIYVGTSSAETPLQQTITFSPVDASAKCATAQPEAGWVCPSWLPPAWCSALPRWNSAGQRRPRSPSALTSGGSGGRPPGEQSTGHELCPFGWQSMGSLCALYISPHPLHA